MKVSLAKPVFDEEMKSAALDALRSERFVMGESIFRFEEEFARYCGPGLMFPRVLGFLCVTCCVHLI